MGLGGSKFGLPTAFLLCQNKNASVKKFLSQDAYTNFFTPMSPVACDQLAELVFLIQGLSVNQSLEDQWSYIWGSPDYSSKKAYKQLMGTTPISPVFKWMWKSCCRGRHKFFFWLLLRDRLNTRNILRRKRRVLDDYSCALCSSNSEETLVHLFFTCSFSQWC